jgi:hypothetical protein
VYTGLLSKPAEAKPNLSQVFLSRLSSAKPAKLNFFKTSASARLLSTLFTTEAVF